MCCWFESLKFQASILPSTDFIRKCYNVTTIQPPAGLWWPAGGIKIVVPPFFLPPPPLPHPPIPWNGNGHDVSSLPDEVHR